MVTVRATYRNSSTVRYDDLPKTVCYGDIELFVIRNPQGGSDIVVAVVDFRNLKGTEQGSEG